MGLGWTSCSHISGAGADHHAPARRFKGRMALTRMTHTRPLQFRPVEGGFGQELVPGHPTRPAREWEVDSWWIDPDEIVLVGGGFSEISLDDFNRVAGMLGEYTNAEG